MIISKTPLRASFFGGGTDFSTYYENSKLGYGTVVSTALDMYVYITVNKKFDDSIRIVYSDNELVSNVDEVKHNIIREALKIVGIERGIEIVYMADTPLSNAGIGLASSSALAVGVLNALHAYKGEFVSQGVLAREACEIEINRLGQRIGIQDQFAVAHGGFNQYKFFSNGSVSVSPIVCRKDIVENLKKNLMLFYTGNTRDSREILNEQSDTIVEKTVMLDDLVNTTDCAVRALYDGNIDYWGTELDRTWNIKKKFAKGISNLLIDEMYNKAKSAGAIGGKILGAGGGGFMLLYVPQKKQDSVKKELADFRNIPFSCSNEGSKIVFYD